MIPTATYLGRPIIILCIHYDGIAAKYIRYRYRHVYGCQHRTPIRRHRHRHDQTTRPTGPPRQALIRAPHRLPRVRGGLPW